MYRVEADTWDELAGWKYHITHEFISIESNDHNAKNLLSTAKYLNGARHTSIDISPRQTCDVRETVRLSSALTISCGGGRTDFGEERGSVRNSAVCNI